jgi:hypothetical protein
MYEKLRIYLGDMSVEELMVADDLFDRHTRAWVGMYLQEEIARKRGCPLNDILVVSVFQDQAVGP